MNDINKQNLITQSNKLIESRFTLTLAEQRIIFAMTSMINPEDEDFREYSIKVDTLAKIIGLKDKDFYAKVQKTTKDIIKKTLQIQQEDGVLQVNWISSAKYIDSEGIVKLSFDPKLKPYLLRLKENFTSTKFGITVKFKSFYTARLYMLIKQYQRIGERTLTVDYLRDIFPQYDLYKDIKRRILIPAQKDICDLSDIKFSFKETKIGRKVKSVTFYNIKSQSYAQELPLYPKALKKEETFGEIINRKYRVDLNVANRMVEKVLEDNDPDIFKKIFEYIDSSVINGNVKNLPGFVVKCIENGYYKVLMKNLGHLQSAQDEKDQKYKFNNQNKYWKEIVGLLKDSFSEEIFEKWLSHLNYIEKKEDKLLLGTEKKFYRDWIRREYQDIINSVIKGFDKEINIIKIISITE